MPLEETKHIPPYLYVALAIFIAVIGCIGTMFSGIGQSVLSFIGSTNTSEPIPNSEATIQAAVSATLGARSNSSSQQPVETNAPIPLTSTLNPNQLSTNDTNLIKNNGFEEGINSGGWEWGQGQIKSITGHDSNTAFCSTQTGTGEQSVNWVGIHQYVSITGGQQYKTAAWLMWENAVQAHIKVLWLNDNFQEIQQDFVMPGTDGHSNGWVQKGGILVAPNGATKARLIFWHGVTNGTTNVPGSELCIDDVVFTIE